MYILSKAMGNSRSAVWIAAREVQAIWPMYKHTLMLYGCIDP